MFDKTFTLTSTDGQVNLSITAGTEGVKSIVVSDGPNMPSRFKTVSAQQLIDLVAPALKEFLATA
jgi:hypothetical protein